MPFLFVLIPLFDLCSTSRYFHYFCSLSSIFCLSIFYFILWSSEHSLSFHLPSSILCSYFNLSFTYFCIPYSALCSFVLFLLLSFHHLSIIPCLPFPTLTTQHSIPYDFVSHFLHSPYYSESCSIKFLPILYLPPACNCCLPLHKYNLLWLQNIFSYKPVLVFGTEQMAIFNSRESKF